tara:strand:- start:9 stop:359 length:351 start_codon:yes stop_codon:yes gene_type:complete
MDRALEPVTSKCRRRPVAARFGPKIAVNGPANGSTCSGYVGNCGCMHAEAKLIMEMLKEGREHPHLEVTLAPCVQCAHLIVAVGWIKRVTYTHDYRDKQGVRIIRNAGLEVEKWRS